MRELICDVINYYDSSFAMENSVNHRIII